MNELAWLQKQSERSLARLLPRIEARFGGRAEPAEWSAYAQRLREHFPRLFSRLHALYGGRYDFFYHLESILASATEMWLVRPADLKALDALRETDPRWYESHRLLGATGYVDLFAGNLEGVRERIPYLSELGVTCLHPPAMGASPARAHPWPAWRRRSTRATRRRSTSPSGGSTSSTESS